MCVKEALEYLENLSESDSEFEFSAANIAIDPPTDGSETEDSGEEDMGGNGGTCDDLSGKQLQATASIRLLGIDEEEPEDVAEEIFMDSEENEQEVDEGKPAKKRKVGVSVPVGYPATHRWKKKVVLDFQQVLYRKIRHFSKPIF